MHIFIDESGIFVVPKGQQHSVSCLGALVIPHENYPAICKEYQELKEKWGFKDAEIKGSSLDEHRFFDTIRLLAKHDVIFELVAIDMGMQTDDGISRHKLIQAEKVMANINQSHQPELIESLKKLQALLRRMPNQLYVQAVATIALAYNALRQAVLYYVQRRPAELGKFRWVIDAKDVGVTVYEDLWSNMMLPMLQTRSFREPIGMVREFDYSSFMRFCHVSEEPPEHLREIAGDVRPFESVDIKAIFREDFSFMESHREVGLQLVDILCNGSRRTMNGNLKPYGLREIGRLIVEAGKGSQEVFLIDLSGGPSRPLEGAPYSAFIQHVGRTSKQMYCN